MALRDVTKGAARTLVTGIVLLSSPNGTFAQSGAEKPASVVPGSTFECTDASIDFKDSGYLTLEEKIERMDQALFDSLSRFDACQDQLSGSATAAANAGGGDAGTGTGTGTGDSVASSDMSGEEAASVDDNGGSLASVPMSAAEPESENQGDPQGGHLDDPPAPEEGQAGSGGAIGAENGKIPEDIPPADNDSVLEAQIRQAAINETDPEIKAKLWDEYRRYKGIKPIH